MAKFNLPGTWEVTVHSSLGTAYPIIVFTADHSVDERADFAPETALGVWRWEDEAKGTFQFTEIRYTASLPPDPPVPVPAGTTATRLRALCSFTGPDAFTGSGCLDALGPGRTLLPKGLGIHQSTFTAVRMQVVPWQDCTAGPS